MSANKESVKVMIKNPCQSPPPTPSLKVSNSTPLKIELNTPDPLFDDSVQTIDICDITPLTWKYMSPSKTRRTFLPDQNQKQKEEFDKILKNCNAPVGFTRNDLNPFSDLNK